MIFKDTSQKKTGRLVQETPCFSITRRKNDPSKNIFDRQAILNRCRLRTFAVPFYSQP